MGGHCGTTLTAARHRRTPLSCRSRSFTDFVVQSLPSWPCGTTAARLPDRTPAQAIPDRVSTHGQFFAGSHWNTASGTGMENRPGEGSPASGWPADTQKRVPTVKILYVTRVARSLTRKEISPAAGRKIAFFFTRILHFVQNPCEKDKKKSTMLPQANRGFIGSNARFEHTPRKSCM